MDTIQVEFKSPLGANATTDQDAFAERILEEVESSGLADKIIVTSFNHGILSRVKKLSPCQRVGVLTSTRWTPIWPRPRPCSRRWASSAAPRLSP